MTRTRSLFVSLLVLVGSLCWLTPVQSAEWTELLRINVEPGQGRSAIPTEKGWAILLEPEGDRFAVFASRTVPPGGPFDDTRLVFETSDGKRHEADCVSSAGGSDDGTTGVLGRLYLNPKGCKRSDIRAVIIEQLTAEGLGKAEARKKEHAEAVEEARKHCPLPVPEVGKPFPFVLTSIDGRELKSEQLKGEVVILEFWASWCMPCVAELPAMKALHEQHKADGLQIIGISFDDGVEMVQGSVKKHGVPWPQVLAGDQTLRQAMGIQTGVDSIPRYFVIDKKGLLHTDRGRGLLEELVPKLLAQ